MHVFVRSTEFLFKAGITVFWKIFIICFNAYAPFYVSAFTILIVIKLFVSYSVGKSFSKSKRISISIFTCLQVARNNARTQLEDAGWRKAQLEEERHHLEEETEVLRATMEDLKLTCQHHLEDKRDLKASLSESQKKLHEALEKLNEKERCFSEERAQFSKQVQTFR